MKGAARKGGGGFDFGESGLPFRTQLSYRFRRSVMEGQGVDVSGGLGVGLSSLGIPPGFSQNVALATKKALLWQPLGDLIEPLQSGIITACSNFQLDCERL